MSPLCLPRTPRYMYCTCNCVGYLPLPSSRNLTLGSGEDSGGSRPVQAPVTVPVLRLPLILPAPAPARCGGGDSHSLPSLLDFHVGPLAPAAVMHNAAPVCVAVPII